MEINITCRESETERKPLTDSMEHCSASMKNDNVRSGVMNTNCIINSMKGKLTDGRNLLIYLSFRCTSDKVRCTYNIGREMYMRTGGSSSLLRNSPG